MPQQLDPRSVSATDLSQQLAHELGVDAYIFGYPLVLMDATKRVATNVPKSGEDSAPLNQFGRKRSFPDDIFTTVVSPNATTLSIVSPF